MAALTLIDRLVEAIGAVCPVETVRIVGRDPLKVTFDPKPEATSGQIGTANQTLAGLDMSDEAHAAWLSAKQVVAMRIAAEARVGQDDKSGDVGSALVRALVAVLLEDRNLLARKVNSAIVQLNLIRFSVSAATSLADLKTRWEADTSTLTTTPEYSMQQLKAVLAGKIRNGEAD